MLHDAVLLELQQILPNIVHPAKESIATAFSKSMEFSKSGDYNESIKWAMIIEDWCWERLHSGHWENVPMSYRGIYSLAVILRADGLSKIGRHSEALGVVDKGMLLGSSVSVLHTMADQLVKVMDDQRLACCESVCTTKRKSCDNETIPLKRMKQNDNECDIITDTNTVDGVSVKNQVSDNYSLIERVKCPSLETFLNEYMKPVKPVIITGCMNHWPAMTARRWSLEYLKRIIGPRTVPVELGSRYTDDGWSQKLMTVNEFIREYIENDSTVKGYLAQHQLFQQVPQLQNDIIVPDYCCIMDTSYKDGRHTDETDDDIKINIWFGPCDTVSPLHFDPQHNLLTQIVGSKYIVLFAVSDTCHLYPHDGVLSNTSQIDIDNPDYNAFPLFVQAKGFKCVLKEGEMLYIPPKWWHFVRSVSISCSVSFWWS